ncbi:MAG: protease pro-enzyme activation domain-containing protein [Candidatus Binatus sp.]
MRIQAQVSGARPWLSVLLFAAVLYAFPSMGRASTGHPDAAPATVRLPGHVLPALAKATVVPSNPKDENAPITLTLVLKRDHQPAFDAYLHDLYNPHSSNFHHYLTQQQIAEKFGPSIDTYRTALEYLRANGFELLHGSPNRLTLTVRGTRAKVERAFDTRIKDYRIGKRNFYANDQAPALPANLASRVLSVGGLSNLAHVTNTVSIKEGFGKLICNILLAPFYPPPGQKFCNYDPTKAWKDCIDSVPSWAVNNTPLDISVDPNLNYATIVPDGSTCPPPPKPSPLMKAEGLAAGATAVHAAARPAASPIGGTGQTIGLVEFDTFEQSDVANYFDLIGLPSSNLANLKTVNVNGGATPGSNQDEVLLDIDTVMTLAEDAKVTVYDAPFQGGASFEDLFNQMISDKVTVISNSWSYCEDETDQADVDSVDSVLQNAAAAGISVFNGAGDTGSTCLDGSANTIGVPADSPHATAVGGTTETSSLGGLYGMETWWDGVSETPPTGQGGFGVSKFFTKPSYQNGLNSMGMRSIPDVVTNADPNTGVEICEASAGGCPDNLFYGGTSIATPIWAAYAALINQAVGTNLGNANTVLYPLAGTSAFHDAASMGSDFQHVGLGSPNLDQMILALSHQTAGSASATGSNVTLAYQVDDVSPLFSLGVPADGATTGIVVVLLADANGNTIPGKTVKLAANPSTNAMISPASAVTSASNGAAVFTVTDLLPETLTLTATDTTDGVQLSTTPTLSFITPPAASAGIVASLSSVANDGTSDSVITVTLKDSLGREANRLPTLPST